MGGTAWSDDHYKDRATLRVAKGMSAFAYSDTMSRAAPSDRKVHEKMDPKGVKLRESRDSEAHPNSLAIVVAFDVTGSMGEVPKILQRNLCGLMGLLIRQGIVEHPLIMVAGIGDATCDHGPLQVGQFESGIEIDQDLERLWLESGGGGHITESYELCMYFLARHTALDCHEKRGKRGYCFIIGDETPYPTVRADHVKELIGDDLGESVATEQIVNELKSTFDVYYILPKMTNHWNNPAVWDRWIQLLGQNSLRLEDPQAICELIATTIGVAEGILDDEGIVKVLSGSGVDASKIGVVSRALATVANTRSVAKRDAALLAGTGLAKL